MGGGGGVVVTIGYLHFSSYNRKIYTYIYLISILLLSLCLRCLQSVIEGCGKHFNEHITQNLLALIFQALNHTNRFVRETGYQLCASLVRLGRQQG